jgi:hypothetical protein
VRETKSTEAGARSAERSFAVKKLNNEVVDKVPLLETPDTRPIKGESLFPEIYANVFLCARKKSGKTSTIYKILKKCCGKKTKVIVFCSTVNKDTSWATIRAWCDHKDIPFVAHTSLKNDDGVDELALLVQELSEDQEQEPKKPPKTFLDSDSEEEEEEKPPKYRAPEYIIILDDLSTELKSKSITSLLKKNRHFRSKILISSQHLNDLLPEGRKQLDYFILFRGHPLKKIEEIHRDADISIPLDEFYRVYKFATEEPYSFLYVDCTTGEFRRNFNCLISLDS